MGGWGEIGDGGPQGSARNEPPPGGNPGPVPAPPPLPPPVRKPRVASIQPRRTGQPKTPWHRDTVTPHAVPAERRAAAIRARDEAAMRVFTKRGSREQLEQENDKRRAWAAHMASLLPQHAIDAALPARGAGRAARTGTEEVDQFCMLLSKVASSTQSKNAGVYEAFLKFLVKGWRNSEDGRQTSEDCSDFMKARRAAGMEKAALTEERKEESRKRKHPEEVQEPLVKQLVGGGRDKNGRKALMMLESRYGLDLGAKHPFVLAAVVGPMEADSGHAKKPATIQMCWKVEELVLDTAQPMVVRRVAAAMTALTVGSMRSAQASNFVVVLDDGEEVHHGVAVEDKDPRRKGLPRAAVIPEAAFLGGERKGKWMEVLKDTLDWQGEYIWRAAENPGNLEASLGMYAWAADAAEMTKAARCVWRLIGLKENELLGYSVVSMRQSMPSMEYGGSRNLAASANLLRHKGTDGYNIKCDLAGERFRKKQQREFGNAVRYVKSVEAEHLEQGVLRVLAAVQAISCNPVERAMFPLTALRGENAFAGPLDTTV